MIDSTGRPVGRAGDRLRARHFWGDHVGTLNYDGRVWAASNRFKGIRLVSLADFCGGKSIINEGCVGNKNRTEILNSYAALESDGYCVLSKNCEHIDNFVRGVGYKSPQIFTVGLIAAGAIFLAAAKR